MLYAKAFIAGFLSTLVFHQGVLTLLWLSGAFPRAPYNMEPAPPFGVPAVISLAFWPRREHPVHTVYYVPSEENRWRDERERRYW